MILVTEAVLGQIRAHARQTYNEECCGVLFGREQGAERIVEAVTPLSNSRDGERHRRFLITPADYRRAEAEAGTRSIALVGFYHSHPDHPARPSAYDLEHAWPFFSYVIVSVKEGIPTEICSFVLKEDRSEFLREEVKEVR
ncbi:MAG: M67 family metallopeptidase [Acidobacteria bacterium]|nr:M67 family metallopeptidase [Acidobacteriota bacterium]